MLGGGRTAASRRHSFACWCTGVPSLPPARCILRRFVNDGVTDCLGSDDEGVTNFRCNDKLEFSCEKHNGTGRCIPLQWVGNGIDECSNGEDERDIILDCHDGFKCLDQTRCLPRDFLCDGAQHCKDGSDEMELCSQPTMYRYSPTQSLIPWSFLVFETFYGIHEFYPDFKPQHDLLFGFKCFVTVRGKTVEFNTLRTVPQFYVVSNISVCSNNEDVCYDEKSEFTCAHCLDGTIISKSQVCDGVVDCRDLSDECPCRKSNVKELCEKVFSFQKKPVEHKINLETVCNGINDTENGIDEKFCNDKVLIFAKESEKDAVSSNFTCSAAYGDTRNYTATADISGSVYCNGVVDCRGMEDECSAACVRRNRKDNTRMRMCFPFLTQKTGNVWASWLYNTSINTQGT